uniref:Protein kinase domain-containing protein n=2 Tax=Macrostomum lignano TaxID=282301 RepID=A0A1I8G032_9PLAT
DTAAHVAARRDHLRLFALLPFEAKWLPNQQGATPLMEAARTGSWRCAKHLLHQLRQVNSGEGDWLLGAQDLEGRTALDLAVLNGHSELASEIEREMRLRMDGDGSIFGLTDQEDEDRWRLWRRAYFGDFAGLVEIATRSNCDLPIDFYFSGLMLAARNIDCRDAALWERLLQLADPTNSSSGRISFLHFAAGSGNLAAASALLNAGASANARNGNGATPLMWAVILAPSTAAVPIARLLLDSGSNWSLKDLNDMTALDLAIKRKHFKLIELLQTYDNELFFSGSQRTSLSEPPLFVEHWTRIRLLGRGRWGVHEICTDTGVKCAAKTVKLPVQSGDQLDSMRNEIDKVIEGESNLCFLSHPNIVKFLRIVQPKPATVVVFMELLDGESLEKFIDNKPLEEQTIIGISKQICSALHYLHSQQPPVIHRDINCTNIIVNPVSERVKLIDFGLSIKLSESISHISGSSQKPKGTLNFMAPEMLGDGEAGRPMYSRESDIWAFGCTVFQMASGARPFADANNLLNMALRMERMGAPALPDGRSAELRDFYSRCTAKERRNRPSAAELMEHEFLTRIS